MRKRVVLTNVSNYCAFKCGAWPTLPVAKKFAEPWKKMGDPDSLRIAHCETFRNLLALASPTTTRQVRTKSRQGSQAQSHGSGFRNAANLRIEAGGPRARVDDGHDHCG